MIHTEKCLSARESERKSRAEYESRWPSYCRKCDGTGFESWRENAAPHGSGELWLLEESEPCEDCIGYGACPRCASDRNNFCTVNSTPVIFICFACGWKEGDPGAPEVLNPYDCGCEVESFPAVF